MREGCPDKIFWSQNTRYNYNSPRLGSASGCAAFGLCVSDFLFGEDASITSARTSGG